jgi:hypothetical protein
MNIMANRKLWDKNDEHEFFKKTLEIATPEKLFYITDDARYLAYWPKTYKGKKTTLQSRNAFIGSYTEKWVKELTQPIAEQFKAYSVHNVICKEIELTEKSPADVAITTTKSNIQKPENILLLIEVKMSIVWNWEFEPDTKKLRCIGDYKTHKGTPGLLRSDTMLKAIGKSLNIMVSGHKSSHIPIIILGNTPITKMYYNKVDHLNQTGITQGFYSVNPKPLDEDSKDNIKCTPQEGFVRIDQFEELKNKIVELLREEKEFFSGMMPSVKLGKIIEVANREATYEKKAEKFLRLIRSYRDEKE